MTYLWTAVGMVAVCGIVMVWPMLFTSKSIRNQRGVPRAAFVSQLAAEGIPERISSAVFDFYKVKARYRSFNPSPDMDIIGVFGELPEDTDDAAIELLKHLDLEAPSESDRRAWPGDDVHTAGDMARWLYWATQHQPTT